MVNTLASLIMLQCSAAILPSDCEFFVDECVNVYKGEDPFMDDQMATQECIDTYLDGEEEVVQDDGE